MSSYHNSFSYLGKNSKTDFNWIVTHFSDNADSGETDTYLSTSAVFSDSYDGTRQTIYGAKYDTVATPQITVIKQDGTEFGIDDNRKALRWLTGARQSAWMDFYIGDEVKYRLLGRVKSVAQYKMDAKVVGLILTFESVSPYGYSSLQTKSGTVNGKATITIPCDSDELYSYVPVNTTFKNTKSNGSLTITNTTTGDVTKITSMSVNEVVTMSDNMVITSDNKAKTFGDTFNFVFPRLSAGDNEITIDGTGSFTFQYITPVKLGDMAIDLNAVSDPICSPDGEIQIDMLDWNRVSNTPNTLAGYGIRDAYPTSSVYNKNEIDNIVKDIDFDIKSVASLASNTSSKLDGYYSKTHIDDNYYNKPQIDDIISNLKYDPSTGPSSSVAWSQIEGKPTTLSEYRVRTEVQDMIDASRSEMLTNDVYTKNQIDDKFSDMEVTIDETELNSMLTEILGE